MVTEKHSDRAPKGSDPYWLDPGFERAVITMCCSKPRFWGRIGHALDPDALALEPSKLAYRACAQVARDNGKGPEGTLIVLQRLRRWMDDGKAKIEDINAVSDLFDAAEDAGLPSEETTVAELKPILSKRIKSEAVRVVMDEYAKDGDFARSTALMAKANRLGDTNTSVGTKLGAGSYAEIEKLKHLERLPLGIMELDQALDGGLRRGGLGVLVGASGDGKSMGLSHVGANSMKAGLFVLYATLEVIPADVLARVKANLTGVPINAILDNPEIVRAQLMGMALGPFIVQEFTPQATTMEDVEAWVASAEEQEGRKVDLLITDYGDKLIAPKSSGRDGENGYTQGRVVFERMRVYANEGHVGGRIWHWTAAQGTRQKDKRKRLDLNDVADSMHKIRVADLVVTLNAQDDDQMGFNVAKHRHGRSKMYVGPLPTDFVCGRIAPVTVDSP